MLPSVVAPLAAQGPTAADHFLAVDFHVAEAVDLTQLVAAKIPKSLFLAN